MFVIILFIKQLYILPIPLIIEFIKRNKTQRGGIDAVAQAAAVSRAVREYVAQMGIRFPASDLGPDHTVGSVRLFDDGSLFDGP